MHAALASSSATATAADTPRGAQARARMLHAALDLFGRHGFDGTRTRMVADAAGMNLGAIAYYFGSKEDLYVAAADHLARFIERMQAESLQTLRQRALRTSSREVLIDLVVDYLCAQARVLLSEAVPASWVQFFLRVQAESGAASERVFTQVVEPAQAEIDALMRRICGPDADELVPRALTFLAFHQVMSVRLADQALLRRLDWDGLTPSRIEQLLGLIGQTLRAQLRAPLQTPLQTPLRTSPRTPETAPPCPLASSPTTVFSLEPTRP